MKIVFASTPTQEEKINELIQTFYSAIFPLYFSDDEIHTFSQLKVLYLTPEQTQVMSTLKTSYQVIASLQTLISILEEPQSKHQYQEMFRKNVMIIEEFGLFFPFQFENFEVNNKLNENETNLSIFSESTNEYLI